MPIRKTPSSSNYQIGALLALTSRTIFSAGSNTTGIKINSGLAFEQQVTNTYGHFVIAASAPSTMTDGLVVSKVLVVIPAATNFATYSITEDLFVPAGYGLYWIATGATTNTSGTVTDVSWSAA